MPLEKCTNYNYADLQIFIQQTYPSNTVQLTKLYTNILHYNTPKESLVLFLRH